MFSTHLGPACEPLEADGPDGTTTRVEPERGTRTAIR